MSAARRELSMRDRDARAIEALMKHLDHFESQQHTTVQIAWLRRHFGTAATR